MTALVEALGFRLARIRGSHHVFIHPLIPDMINLQASSGMAKPYQVRQVLKVIEEYNLRLGDEA
jgi:predicted RNA binding protein YcfA (HicA-like mRNA interferase family)